MGQSAAVLCRDHRSLRTLEGSLEELGMESLPCKSGQEALEQVLAGRCSTLIVDFDLPGAEEVIRMAALLPPAQKPNLLAVASRAWPGTGQAFHSGANRILYRPLDPELLKDALKNEGKPGKKPHRKSTRYEMKALVYLSLETVTLAAITIDISEHGLALQATEPVPITSSLPFRCVLPGTDFTLQGQADVIWASDKGRAGLFFSKLGSASQKHLKQWLRKRSHAEHGHKSDSLRDLLPPADAKDDAHVAFSVSD
jgi:CheY-like chemotaxis protein